MNHDPKDKPVPGHGDYERRDIGVGGVLYFLAGLAAALFIVYFSVQGVYRFLDYRTEHEQPTLSPLVKNVPSDTRRIPPQYNENYEKFLQEQFPAPQLEINERTELNDIRLREENTLSSYGWIDKDAGKLHIPIDRAMDLLIERGLPVRTEAPGTATQQAQPQTKKGNKQ
jgi:hypothetical protein